MRLLYAVYKILAISLKIAFKKKSILENHFMERKFNRISFNPNQMNGQACIRELRITVKRVLEIISIYPSRAEIFKDYPELEEEDIKQALEYVSLLLQDKIIPFSKVA